MLSVLLSLVMLLVATGAMAVGNVQAAAIMGLGCIWQMLFAIWSQGRR